MFFSEIELSRKAWHFRLQSWFFGKPPFTKNFCPYFWLTIFCMIVAVPLFPLWMLFKGLVIVMTFTMKVLDPPFRALERLLDRIDDSVCKPFAENRLRSLDDEDVYRLSCKAGWRPHYPRLDYNGNNEAEIKKFKRWMSIVGDDWQEKVRAAWNARSELKAALEQRKYDQWVQKQARNAAREENARKRQQTYAKIAIYTKWVVVPLVVAFAVVMSLAVVAGVWYGGYRLIVWLSSVPIFDAIKHYGPYVVIVLVILALFVALVFGIIKLARCVSYWNPKLPSLPFDGKDIANWVVRVGESIASPFQIFIEYAKTFKQNHCPAIIWKEEK